MRDFFFSPGLGLGGSFFYKFTDKKIKFNTKYLFYSTKTKPMSQKNVNIDIAPKCHKNNSVLIKEKKNENKIMTHVNFLINYHHSQ